MTQVANYPLALLKLMDEVNEYTKELPLGMAERFGADSSKFNVPAHKILQALITHAPSPQKIASEFLFELGKCGNALVETLGVLLR